MGITLQFRAVSVVLLSRDECHKARRANSHRKRRAFRNYAKSLLRQERVKLSPVLYRDLQEHHIIPLSLGGSNDKANKALVPSKDHQEIHQIITAQILGMRVGEHRTILLPYSPAPVWAPAG